MKHGSLRAALKKELNATLTPGRLRHVLGTAEQTVSLAKHYRCDPDRAEIAALVHDLAREWPRERIEEWALDGGYEPSPVEIERPVLLHGRAAAAYVSRRFGVDDDDVLNASINHTFGSPGLSDIGLVLYCADFLEPGRPWSAEYSTWSDRLGLKQLAAAVARETVRFLERDGKGINPATRDFIRWCDENAKC